MRFGWLTEAVLVSACGVVLGLALNQVSPRPIALGQPVYAASASGTAVCGGSEHGAGAAGSTRSIALAEAVSACGACSSGFVDARGAAAFALGHIPGAVHLPPAGHGDSAALAGLRRFQTVVVYDFDAGGGAPGCRLADAVADRLRAAGFSDVRILDGSWNDWQAAGGPAVSGACGACADGHDHASREGGPP